MNKQESKSYFWKKGDLVQIASGGMAGESIEFAYIYDLAKTENGDIEVAVIPTPPGDVDVTPEEIVWYGLNRLELVTIDSLMKRITDLQKRNLALEAIHYKISDIMRRIKAAGDIRF
jgi:hypothetical protein